MADRRMFSKTVVNSARFLRMPQTTRLLYYDLGMAADDDGIVEAFTVIRTTGAAEDDLRVLASRGFIIVLNEDLVSYITDWSTNNQLRKDRYHPSVYSELLVKVVDGNGADANLATTWQPHGNRAATEVSIGKDSIGKVSISPPKSPSGGGVDQAFERFWTAYPKKVGKGAARKSFQKVKVPIDTLIAAIEEQKRSDQWNRDNGQYIPNPATWLNQERWNDQLQEMGSGNRNRIRTDDEYLADD